jgi:protein-tyrosine phosphatase
MIDIHSHILWGLDDGAESLEDSLAMLELAARSGTTGIVATPHANAEYEHRPALIDARIRELAARLSSPRIYRGCDFHLTFDNVDRLLANPSAYTIAGKQYLLVECPDLHVGPHTEGVLERLIAAGLVPIVTHPERNPVLQRELGRVEAWVNLGCLVQVTALAVTGGFGRRAFAACHRLLGRGMAHVVASDAHDPVRRNTRLDEAREAIRARYGEEAAELLFTANPEAIVAGAEVARGRQPFGAKAPWWQFWK